MGKRRGNNEGSLYRRQDGLWCARVSIGGRRVAKYGHTQRECREWLKETLARAQDGLSLKGEKDSLETYFHRWLKTIKPSLRPSTWEEYEQIGRQHILPALGRLRLMDLRPDHIQGLYADRLASGLGAGTVRLIHAVLHRALQQAVKWGLLRRNPSDVVDKPKLPRREMQTLSLAETRRLLEAAQGSRLEALLYVAIATGLRQGELLGLRWSDLEWRTGGLQVQRQMQRLTGQGKGFVETKTAAGRRLVMLGPATLAQLGAQRKRQNEVHLFAGGRWQEQGLIFTSGVGTALEPRTLLRQFKALLAAAKLPDIRFHDLRHTAATLMLQQGVHPKVVQERLGHATIGLTLDTYSHIVPGMQTEAAERLDAALGGLAQNWNSGAGGRSGLDKSGAS